MLKQLYYPLNPLQKHRIRKERKRSLARRKRKPHLARRRRKRHLVRKKKVRTESHLLLNMWNLVCSCMSLNIICYSMSSSPTDFQIYSLFLCAPNEKWIQPGRLTFPKFPNFEPPYLLLIYGLKAVF